MKFLIDLSVESDALMFQGLMKELNNRGHTVLVTARKIAEANRLQWFLGLNPIIVGTYSGSREGKLLASAERVRDMTNHVLDVLGGLDGVVSNTGVEACRVGFGLGARVHTFHDHPNPEAAAQMKLTIPLSDYVYAPWVIPKEAYTKYGLEEDQVVSYRGFLAMAWLPFHQVDDNILGRLGLQDKVVVFRESEVKASYLYGKQDITLPAVYELSRRWPDFQFVARPRYSAETLKSYFGDRPNVRILENPLDMRSLLSKAELFIGGGATMCLESCYYGTPTINTRPIRAPITDFLEAERISFKADTPQEAIILANMHRGNSFITRSREVFGELSFPLQELVENLESSPR